MLGVVGSYNMLRADSYYGVWTHRFYALHLEVYLMALRHVMKEDRKAPTHLWLSVTVQWLYRFTVYTILHTLVYTMSREGTTYPAARSSSRLAPGHA